MMGSIFTSRAVSYLSKHSVSEFVNVSLIVPTPKPVPMSFSNNAMLGALITTGPKYSSHRDDLSVMSFHNLYTRNSRDQTRLQRLIIPPHLSSTFFFPPSFHPQVFLPQERSRLQSS